MAEILNSNEIYYQSFEPKVQNRFIMYIDGIPAFVIKKTDRPNVTSERKELDHINLKRYYKGKTTWGEIAIELYDPIVPSAAQAMMEWLRLSHESATGRGGYQDMYKKDIIINILGPVGDKIESWKLIGAFPTSIDFGNADWSSGGESLNITANLSIDYAILEY